MKEMLTMLFDYNWASNRLILDCAAPLTDEQLAVANDVSHLSLLALLFHTMSVEFIWRNLCASQSIPADRPMPGQFGDVETMAAYWDGEHQAMEAYLANLDDAQLADFVTLAHPRGGEQRYTRWQILSHLLLHSMQHRAEAAAILTQLGQSPGDMDFIFHAGKANAG